jgi:hypothetical protein
MDELKLAAIIVLTGVGIELLSLTIVIELLLIIQRVIDY